MPKPKKVWSPPNVERIIETEEGAAERRAGQRAAINDRAAARQESAAKRAEERAHARYQRQQQRND